MRGGRRIEAPNSAHKTSWRECCVLVLVVKQGQATQHDHLSHISPAVVVTWIGYAWTNSCLVHSCASPDLTDLLSLLPHERPEL